MPSEMKKKIDELRAAEKPVLIERGEDNSVLIIAFTGFIHRLSMRVYEFFDLTKASGYSRILLRDENRVWYHHGIDRQRNDYPSLLRYLQSEIEKLNPQKIICLGTSAGGYAAIVAGHHLGADYVHAFAPHTLLEVSVASCLGRFRRSLYRWARLKLLFSRVARREFFDLGALLKNHNGKTLYYIHHCAGIPRDVEGVARIAGLPGVVSMPYPCAAHSVPSFLAKVDFLKEILNINNQHKLAELARAHFVNMAGDDRLAK